MFVVGTAIALVVGAVASLVVPPLLGAAPLERLDSDHPLVILSGRDDSLGGQRQQLVDAWNALHPDQKARIVVLPAIADAQRAEMLARAQADDGGVDVYNLDVTWTAEFADADYIAPLDESTVPTAGFLPGPLATCHYANQLWALPFNADVGLLYYRSDLLDEVGRPGPPASWDAVLDDAEAVRAEHGDVAPYVGQLAEYEGLTVTALEMIGSAGGTVVDDDGHVLPHPTDYAAVRAGLDRLRDLDPAVSPLDETSSLQRFQDGKALFMRNWPVAYRSLGDNAQDGPALKVRVAALPGGSAILGGQNLAVSKKTARPRAARALVEFLTGERSEQQLFQRGGLPATRDVVYTDFAALPDVKRAFPFVTELYDALLTARPRPAAPHYAQFSEAFRTSVDAYLHDPSALPEDAFRARLEAALKGQAPAGG